MYPCPRLNVLRYLTNKQINIDMWLDPLRNSQAVGDVTNPQHYVHYTISGKGNDRSLTTCSLYKVIK